mgnify:CR=1 FL=1
MKKRGFTLIELLVVIAILAILITLGSKGLRNARISAKKAQAMVEIKSIETAIKSYQRKYGKLPGAHGADVEFDLESDSPEQDESATIISALTLADDMDESANPASMVFLDSQLNGSSGAFLDPWGFQYRIALDTDYDGQILINDEVVRRSVAVASIGLYALKNFANTNDIIKSWQ